MSDLEIRVAKLEIQREVESKDCAEFQCEIAAALKELKVELHDLKLQREKQMSFLGGIAAVVSVIAGFTGFIINKYF